VFDSCYDRLDEGDFLLRQWSALCIGQIWDANDEIKVYGVDKGTQDKLRELLSDESPEVRAAVLFALGTFMGASGSADKNKTGGGGSGTMLHLNERTHFQMEVAVVYSATSEIKEDASPMVRKELLVVISCLVKEWRGHFVVCAWLYWEEDRRRNISGSGEHDEDLAAQAVKKWLDTFTDDEGGGFRFRKENRDFLSSFFAIFSVLLDLCVDPYQEVSTNAQTILDYIMALLLESPFTRLDGVSFDDPPAGSRTPQSRSFVHSLQTSPSSHPPSSPMETRPPLSHSNTMSSHFSVGVTNTLKRTSSIATAFKNLAFPHAVDGTSSPNLSLHSKPDHATPSLPPSPNLNFAQYTSPYPRPQTPTSQSVKYPIQAAGSSLEYQQPAMDFLPSDVMEALMEEDMERLRARRRAGSGSRRNNRHHHGHNHNQNGGGALSSPVSSTFSNDSNGSRVILGLGTGVGIRNVLPLKSRCYDWCLEYFKEPQMRVSYFRRDCFG
jgi:regulator-associated protein of mTOR